MNHGRFKTPFTALERRGDIPAYLHSIMTLPGISQYLKLNVYQNEPFLISLTPLPPVLFFMLGIEISIYPGPQPAN